MTRRRWSTKDRAAIFLAADGLCHICSGKIATGEAWELEHVIPLAQGGDDEAHNLRPAHFKCHKAKTAADAGNTAKAKRREAAHRGWKAPSTRPMPFGRKSAFKRKMDGSIVPRERG